MPRSNTVSRLHQRWITTLLRHYDPATLLATVAHCCLSLSDDSEQFTASSGVEEKAYVASMRSLADQLDEVAEQWSDTVAIMSTSSSLIADDPASRPADVRDTRPLRRHTRY